MRRDRLDRGFKSLKVGLMLCQAREKKEMTQEQLGQIIQKNAVVFPELKMIQVI